MTEGNSFIRFSVKDMFAEIQKNLAEIKTLQHRHEQEIKAALNWQAEHEVSDRISFAKLDILVEQSKINQEVRAALARGWTRGQKVLAALVTLVVLAGEIYTLYRGAR